MRCAWGEFRSGREKEQRKEKGGTGFHPILQNDRRIVIVPFRDWFTLSYMKKLGIGCAVLAVIGLLVLIVVRGRGRKL